MRFRWVLVLLALVSAGLGACGDDDDAVTTVPATAAETTVAGTEAGSTDESPTTAPQTTTTMPAAEIAVEVGAVGVAPQVDLGSAQGVLLFEDFQDGQAGGWDLGGGWFVFGSGDHRVFSASGDAWAWFPPGSSWDGYVLRVAALVLSGGLALSFDVGDDGRYLVHLHTDGVFLLEDRPWGTFTTLAAAAPVATGQWHLVTLGREGGHIQVYVDGELWLDHTVDDPLPGGTIGLGATAGSAVAVDNVLVTALLRSLPPGDPVAAAAPAPDPAEPEPPAVEEPPLEEGDPDTEALLPNLTLAGVGFNSDSYHVGDTAIVDVLVTQDMAVNSNYEIHVLGPDGSVACSIDFVGFDGPGTEFSLCATTPFTEEGTWGWSVLVDATDVIAENESAKNVDNVAYGSLFIQPPQFVLVEEPKPDLKIDDFVFAPRQPTVTETVQFQVGVAQFNPDFVGEIPPFSVRLSIDGGPFMTWPVEPAERPPWRLGHTSREPFLAGVHRYSLLVDSDDTVDELVEDPPITGEFVVVDPNQPHQVDLIPDRQVYVGSIGPDPGGVQALISVGWDDHGPGPWPGETFATTLNILDLGQVCEWTSDIGALGVSCWVVFPEPGEYRWRLQVDTTNVYNELEEGNNSSEGVLTIPAP